MEREKERRRREIRREKSGVRGFERKGEGREQEKGEMKRGEEDRERREGI